MVEPSFKAIKRLLLNVLIHPLIVTSCKMRSDANILAILLTFIWFKVDVAILFALYLLLRFKQTPQRYFFDSNWAIVA